MTLSENSKNIRYEKSDDVSQCIANEFTFPDNNSSSSNFSRSRQNGIRVILEKSSMDTFFGENPSDKVTEARFLAKTRNDINSKIISSNLSSILQT